MKYVLSDQCYSSSKRNVCMCVAYTHAVYRNKEIILYLYKYIQESTVSDTWSFLRLLWVQGSLAPSASHGSS